MPQPNDRLGNRLAGDSGKVRLGLIVFVFLLGLVAGQFTYRFLTTANRLNDEAVELMNQGKYDSALAKLDEALAEKPNHVRANYHRGICLAEKHRWDEALQAFERTIALDPNQARAHFNRGKILWTQGRFAEAAASLERATEIKTPFPDAWILLAESYYEQYLRQMIADPSKAGSPARAVAAFKTYLKQRPGAPDARTVDQKLEIIRHLDRYPEVLEKRRKGTDPSAPRQR